MDSTHSPRYVGKQRIFISYRRDDSQWVAGRLADSLAAYFGDDRVFRDIDGIVAGERFADVIDNTLIGGNGDNLSALDDTGAERSPVSKTNPSISIFERQLHESAMSIRHAL